MYAANLIDNGPLGFARAEVATIRETFDHVAVAADPVTLARTPGAGGNIVVVASDAPLDLPALRAALAERDLDWGVIDGAELDAWVGDAMVLTDDHAPVDQLLTPYRTVARPPASAPARPPEGQAAVPSPTRSVTVSRTGSTPWAGATATPRRSTDTRRPPTARTVSARVARAWRRLGMNRRKKTSRSTQATTPVNGMP